ncbi:MAG: GNAT family N-acetyltransferase [Pyrinomonadaceae bacterium]|nr:GNAT family N-acetyltransferase [Pyrinomonadaceae bacterium]
MRFEPVTLKGKHVRLEPLSAQHLDGLCEFGLDPELWRWTTNSLRTREDMIDYVETALQSEREGTARPFATISMESDQVIGCTRFGNIDLPNRHVEIGWTWVGVPWQRTAVNTEAKYLMLHHAFDTLGCIRVEFKTDSLNGPSRRALLRIGAKEEGTMRNHMIVHDGRYRDSVYFSVIDSEWPEVKANLEANLSYQQTK